MPPRIARRPGPAWLVPTLTILLTIALLALPRSAGAWVEVHVAGDDVRLTVDRGGAARVEHKVTLKISGGPLRSLDIPGVDPDAAPEPDGYVVPLRDAQRTSLASASPVALELLPRDRPREDGSLPPPMLRVRFDGKGIARGVYVLFFRYRTELGKRGLMREQGALARLTWSGPVWDDGLDQARLILELPSAPTEPRPDQGEAAPDELIAPPMTLSTVRRGRERDELELVRPYAPKGEPIRWVVLADARAFRPAAPEAPPARALPLRTLEAAVAWTPERRRTLILAAAGALFALYSALVALKALEVQRLCRAAGVAPRPLVPLPLPARAAAAGLAIVAGVALQLLLKTGTAGAALVALASALAAHRTPQWTRAAALRGPGKWLPVAEAEAFRLPPRPRGAILDITTRASKILFAALLAALAAGAYAAHLRSPYYAHLIALDAVALLAVFCTGRLSELPPDPAAAPVPFLRDVARRLKRSLSSAEARVVGRIRLPDGSPDADELRLGVSLRAALPGFAGIEVGLVYAPGAGGAIALPEVLLRVTAGSPCERAVERLSRSGRSSRGRRPDERVLAFAPRLPTARMTAGIAAALARAVAAPAAEAQAEAKRKGRGRAASGQGRAKKKAVPAAA
jgi:hypothetical protein